MLLGINKDFLGHINHTIKLKKKMIGLIRINNFCLCIMKGNYKQREKIAFRMGENNSKRKTDKELISKIYKQLLQPNYRKNK